MKYRVITIAGLLLCMIAVWGFSGGWFLKRPVAVDATEFIMDTVVSVKLYHHDRKRGEELIAEAFKEALRIERMMEAVKGDGEIRRLNQRDSNGWFELMPELGIVLREAQKYHELSGGAFDPSVAPVKWLWDFEDGGYLPSQSELEQKLPSVGLENVTIHGDSILFLNSDIQLDLGGVAKGFAVDRMIEYLSSHGVESILVNAGGDIATLGKKPAATFFGAESDWVIGMRHPRLNRTIVLKWNPYPAVATSGDYQRFFMKDGVRYHHIIDPATGYPASKCASVTVWTKSAMLADLLATTIFVLGPGKGVEFAESLDSVETLIYFERNGNVESVMSSGIEGRIGI